MTGRELIELALQYCRNEMIPPHDAAILEWIRCQPDLFALRSTSRSFDVCECGDYRSSHADDGYGACKICAFCGPYNCMKFRIDKQGTKEQRRRIIK